MPTVTASTRINAPRERVFDIFSDLRAAPSRIKAIKKIDMLTQGPIGQGTRWTETRTAMGREQTLTLEITAWNPPQSYTADNEYGGSRFLSTFTFQSEGNATVVTGTVTSTAMTFSAKLMSIIMVLMKGACRKMLEQDMADLKAVAEGAPTAAQSAARSR